MQGGSPGRDEDGSPPRRTSLDHLYSVVGETVASGLASLSTRLVPPAQADAKSDAPAPGPAPSRSEAPGGADGAPLRGHETLREAALAEEGARLRDEIEQLRAEVQTHARAAARAAKVVDALRVARDGGQGQSNVHVRDAGDVDRIEKEAVAAAVEKERKRARAANEAAKASRRQCAALERVCVGLRSRLAVAEERATRGLLLDQETRGKKMVEAELERVKAERERCEARAIAAEAAADDTEDQNRAQREAEARAAILEEELRSRDRLLREMDADRARLSSYLLRYEDQFQQKETEILELTRLLAQSGTRNGRRRRGHSRSEASIPSRSSSDGGYGEDGLASEHGGDGRYEDGTHAGYEGRDPSPSSGTRVTVTGGEVISEYTRDRDEGATMFDDTMDETRSAAQGRVESHYDTGSEGEDTEMTQTRTTNYP